MTGKLIVLGAGEVNNETGIFSPWSWQVSKQTNNVIRDDLAI